MSETEKELYERLQPLYANMTRARPYGEFVRHWNKLDETKPGSNAGTAMKLALESVGIETRTPWQSRMEAGAEEYEEIMSLQQAVEG